MNTKTLKALTVAMSLAAGMGATFPTLAAVPAFDNIGRPAIMQCTPALKGRILHSDKIIFKILPGVLVAVNPADQGALNQLPRGYEMDIKVSDDPRTIAGLRGKVLSFMGAALTTQNVNLITIVDVDYATSVCL
jgi:hypothetical protein